MSVSNVSSQSGYEVSRDVQFNTGPGRAEAAQAASSAPTQQARPEIISWDENAISADTIMAIMAYQNQQTIETNGGNQAAKSEYNEYLQRQAAGTRAEQSAGMLNGLINNEDGNDLFTRLETSRQKDLGKADGKLSRNDLKAALKSGSLSPEERAQAEYLLANFSTLANGKYIRKESLTSFSAGLQAANDPNVPLKGLSSFSFGIEEGMAFLWGNGDFRDLGNGGPINKKDLEKGLEDNDFSKEQKDAIRYMLENFDVIAQGNDKIHPQELRTFVEGIEQGRQANSADAFSSYPIAGDFLAEFGLTRITQAELQNILNNGVNSQGEQYTSAEWEALEATLANFHALQDQSGYVSVETLQSVAVGPEDGLQALAGGDRRLFASISPHHYLAVALGNPYAGISRDELTQAINSGSYSDSELAALLYLNGNFDSVAGSDGRISQRDIKDVLKNISTTNNLHQSTINTQVALAQAFEHSHTFSATAHNVDFLNRLDQAHSADDQGFGVNYLGSFSPYFQELHEADRANSSYFTDYGGKTQAPDRQVSRQDLQAALASNQFSEEEKAFITVLAENFNNISGGDNVITNQQIWAFAPAIQAEQENAFDTISQEQNNYIPAYS